MTMPTFRVKDLMERTKQNLDFVWTRHKEFKLWEVTQLVNSFLGAFVHVKEAFYKEIPDEPYPKPGWPVIRTDPGYRDPKNQREFVRWIRNALAHGNIDCIPDEQDDIAAIHIWNYDLSCSKTWGAQIPINDVKQLLDEFVNLMTPILEQHEVKP